MSARLPIPCSPSYTSMKQHACVSRNWYTDGPNSTTTLSQFEWPVNVTKNCLISNCQRYIFSGSESEKHNLGLFSMWQASRLPFPMLHISDYMFAILNHATWSLEQCRAVNYVAVHLLSIKHISSMEPPHVTIDSANRKGTMFDRFGNHDGRFSELGGRLRKVLKLPIYATHFIASVSSVYLPSTARVWYILRRTPQYSWYPRKVFHVSSVGYKDRNVTRRVRCTGLNIGCLRK